MLEIQNLKESIMKSQEEQAALAGVDLSHLTEEEIQVKNKLIRKKYYYSQIIFLNFW